MLFELHDAIAPLPGSTKARELLLRRAQEYLDSLSREAKGDPTLERERALAYQRIGDLMASTWQANFGKSGLAMENQRKAMALFQGLLAADPGNIDVERDLATTCQRVCSLDQANGKFHEAMEDCGKDLALRESIAKVRPGDPTAQYELGYSYQALASPLFLMGDFKRSEQYRAHSLARSLHPAAPGRSGQEGLSLRTGGGHAAHGESAGTVEGVSGRAGKRAQGGGALPGTGRAQPGRHAAEAKRHVRDAARGQRVDLAQRPAGGADRL